MRDARKKSEEPVITVASLTTPTITNIAATEVSTLGVGTPVFYGRKDIIFNWLTLIKDVTVRYFKSSLVNIIVKPINPVILLQGSSH